MHNALRRTLCASGLRLLLGSALLQYAARAHAIEGSLKWAVRPWLQRLEESSTALSAGALRPAAWQVEVEAVLRQLDLRDLLASLDFERLAATAKFPSQGEGMERLYFLEPDGRIQPLRFRPFLFTLRKDRAVVPHGHHNMATMHCMLAGRARVRHFDRLETTDTHMLIRATSDRLAAPGDISSVSDEANNIHWFQGLSDQVFMFNIGVYQVDPSSPFGERDYVDPLGAESLGNGILRAERMSRSEAYAKYGRA
jgi:hypothetical protein